MAYKRFTASAKQLAPDAKYGSKLISKFINCMMWDGKKSTSARVFYDALDIVAQRVKDVPPAEVFEKAVENVKPNIQVRSKRVGGSNYQVPMQVNRKRQMSLAIRWMLQAVRARSGKATCEFLAQEICDAYRREGTAMQTRDNVHRMAEANKAFAHFAW
ncbi:MAG: 30S ribosomal protein S7 [Phycisphaerae bacterium]